MRQAILIRHVVQSDLSEVKRLFDGAACVLSDTYLLPQTLEPPWARVGLSFGQGLRGLYYSPSHPGRSRI